MFEARYVAVQLLLKITQQHYSLEQAFLSATQPVDAFTKACVYEVCRYYHRLQCYLQKLLDKPLKNKDADVQNLMLIGICDLVYLTTPDYAAIQKAVEATKALNKSWAKGLVNAVLREFLRQKEVLVDTVKDNLVARYSHPMWLIQSLKVDWPDYWQRILTENNQHPPLTLRVNIQETTVSSYLSILTTQNRPATVNPHVSTSLTLARPCQVYDIPNFSQGWVSVQDAAAQLAVSLLDLHPKQRVLDACAAPGGKTGHILESQPQLSQLIAIEKDQARAVKIHENLNRLHQDAQVICADATQPKQWWDGKLFDRILLDAPCSATGVIRRHPDIKLLRRESDVTVLAKQQLVLLRQLWPLLAPGGRLLYATCSVLRAENEVVINQFLGAQSDALAPPMHVHWGHQCQVGRQILPGEEGMDGFYYAVLEKKVAKRASHRAI